LLLNAPVAIINDVISVFSPEANMKEAGFIILTPLKTLHTPGKAEVRDINIQYSTISSRKFII
jgi:hypothetical protein